MKITRLPASNDQETAQAERDYFEFIAELRIISNRHGLALRRIDEIWTFDPEAFEVRYEQDDDSGVLMPNFRKTSTD